MVRTNKLFLISETLQNASNAYLQAVKRISYLNLNKEENYIKFLSYYIKVNSKYDKDLLVLLKNYINRRPKDFMFLCTVAFGQNISNIIAGFYEKLSNDDPQYETIEAKSDFQASAHNVLRGAIVDNIFALIRFFNFYAIHHPKDGHSIIVRTYDQEGLKIVMKAMQVASMKNSMLAALDKLSYDEADIENVEYKKGKPSFVLTPRDFIFEKARDINLKRTLSQLMAGRKKQRWLAELFEEFGAEVLTAAWEYYQEHLNIFVSGTEHWIQAKKDLAKILDWLDADDELLFSENEEIISHYLTVLAMVIFVSAAQSMAGKGKSSYALICPTIPRKIIEEILFNTEVGTLKITSKIDEYIQELPARHHMDYFRKPFFVENDGSIYAMDLIALDNWPQVVRMNLVQGGETGAVIGVIWEKYIAFLLKDFGCEKIFQGVKITEKGRIITDIDILAKRRDLLMVIQLKTHYGSGNHAFEQWKFKQKLIHGVQQVKMSEKNILTNPSILKHKFSETEIKEIKTIKPLVMTNSHLLNGWKYDDVPIVSSGSLNQWINGAEVSYSQKGKEPTLVKKIIENETFSTSDILDLIETPLDWRIGNQNYTTTFHNEKFDGFSIQFPIIASGGREFRQSGNKLKNK